MSRILINEYLRRIEELRRMSGSSTEKIISDAFQEFLKAWARSAKLHFLPQHDFASPLGTRVVPDGAVVHELRVPLGWWEAKDTADDLDVEIAKKLKRGYPQDNIVFENSATAVLHQNRAEVMRCAMTEGDGLLELLKLFFAYERPEIALFRKAVQQFRGDLPHVLDALRAKIDDAYAGTEAFRATADRFLAHARETINPTLTEADVREMLIQHILTEEIFTQVFGNSDFHRDNNIAKQLYALEGAFFTGGVKRDTLKGLEPYYAAIRANAAQITGHAEKQTFLKVIYENFYKVYNPKAADRLGVVYTPNEIVRFMIEGADWLCHKHFGKTLIDPDVEILDPATGTGTFICELIEHFRGQPKLLERKYRNELHANEVAILPYYVANLNIEATYAAVTGGYVEFPNLCFVDTLDNVAGLGIRAGHQHEMFGAMSEENVKRVRDQNKRKISVIIGNPPYNAWQENFNQRNPNRSYKKIDQRIKETYALEGSSQSKIGVYDMYARFFRWASDRLHDEGIIAFISNRSFIDSQTFDGFRRSVAAEFNESYIVDLRGDARTSGEQRRREGGNIFENKIRVGIALSFFVKKKLGGALVVHYETIGDYMSASEKQGFISAKKLSDRTFLRCDPDLKANWINKVENNWDDFVTIASRAVKSRKIGHGDEAIFRIFSNGLKTQRDEWVYDFNRLALDKKVRYLVATYEATRIDANFADRDTVKWDRELIKYANRNIHKNFSETKIIEVNYRPFVLQFLYYDKNFNAMSYRIPAIFGPNGRRIQCITIMGDSSGKPYFTLAIDRIPDLNFVSPASGGTQTFPRYRYAPTGEQIDNITDWALKQFREHYGKTAEVSKDTIFTYVYGVLHDPVYRETYAINLKREFPRIPFYPDFRRWAEWGARLMDLHIGYETVEPWPLTRIDVPDAKAAAAGLAPRAILKADRDAGIITLDTETQLGGVPAEAWGYRLGNRTALDWVLDQHKEKTPKDPTIRARFNTYRFADHKERVAELLGRVARVSVETMAIVEAMRGADRGLATG